MIDIISRYPLSVVAIIAVLIVAVLILIVFIMDARSQKMGFYGGCKKHWDPAAIAEAQGLVTVGSYAEPAYHGERRLQCAMNGYDSNWTGITQEQYDKMLA